MTAPKKQPLPYSKLIVAKVCNSTTKGNYETAKHSATQAMRPGADNALAHPSRHGDHLHHRDGRITLLCGKPVASRQITAAANKCAGNQIYIR